MAVGERSREATRTGATVTTVLAQTVAAGVPELLSPTLTE